MWGQEGLDSNKLGQSFDQNRILVITYTYQLLLDHYGNKVFLCCQEVVEIPGESKMPKVHVEPANFHKMSEIQFNTIVKSPFNYQIFVKTKIQTSILTPVSIVHSDCRPAVSPLSSLQQCCQWKKDNETLLWCNFGNYLAPMQVSDCIKLQIQNAGLPKTLKLYALLHIGVSKAQAKGIQKWKIQQHARKSPQTRMFDQRYNLHSDDVSILAAICKNSIYLPKQPTIEKELNNNIFSEQSDLDDGKQI
ncbi:MAG: hypothetical protein EZS28_033001 [Streblomastix strix]|uniref:Uncharacterized protein n=1 Tax=Streblomastix strix TaxID=222440 RepID=A0A5J4UN68_9EUKA|nr:MAG: hypothetical protein EZS28_033001 [Streblomastix strix]